MYCRLTRQKGIFTVLKATDSPLCTTVHSKCLPLGLCKETVEESRAGHFFLFFGFTHDDVIKWKHFPRNWPFVRGIQRLPVNSPHKIQWRGALMFSLICVGMNGWVNKRDAGDLSRHRAHYGVTVMLHFYSGQSFDLSGASELTPENMGK